MFLYFTTLIDFIKILYNLYLRTLKKHHARHVIRGFGSEQVLSILEGDYGGPNARGRPELGWMASISELASKTKEQFKDLRRTDSDGDRS